MSVRIQAIDHVQLPLPPGAAARARAFYEGVLGLRPLPEEPCSERPGTLRYRLGPQRLDLAEGPSAGAAPQAHLALRVHGVAALAQGFRARGLPVDGPRELPAPPGEAPRLRLYIEDPFGNRLELIEGGHQELHDALELHFAV